MSANLAGHNASVGPRQVLVRQEIGPAGSRRSRYPSPFGGLTAVAAIVGSAAVVEHDPEDGFAIIGFIGWVGLFA